MPNIELKLLETIQGPDGEAEIFRVKHASVEVIVDELVDTGLKDYCVEFDGDRDYFDDLHDARSHAQGLVGNNEDD